MQVRSNGALGVSFQPAKLRMDGVKVEPSPINIENIIYEALIHEGKHTKVLQSKRAPLQFNEKELREAAHAEVAQATGMAAAENEKSGKRKKDVDTAEKVQQSRDRNREHAKYTRLRKKAYVAKLKDLMDELRQSTDIEERDRRAFGEKLHYSQTVRKQIVQQFLVYRARNCRERERWAAILDEAFVFTIPITPFRSFHRKEIQGSHRVVRGIDAMMAECASLALMAESIGLGSPKWRQAIKRNAACRVEYTVRPEDIVCSGELVMCRYTMHIRNCEAVGGVGSCVQHGMLQCSFAPRSDRIVRADLIFDVMGFMQQLQACWGISPESSIVPNTLDTAIQPTKEPQAILSATAPYAVLHSTEAWIQLTGHHRGSEGGHDMALLQLVQVYAFQRELLLKLASECARGVPGSAIFLSHGREREQSVGADGNADSPGGTHRIPTVFYIKLLPLASENDQVTHLLASLVELPLTPEEIQATTERAAALTQPPRAPPAGAFVPVEYAAQGSVGASQQGAQLVRQNSFGNDGVPPPPPAAFHGFAGARPTSASGMMPSQPGMYVPPNASPSFPTHALPYPMMYAGHPSRSSASFEYAHNPAVPYLTHFPTSHTSAAGMAAPGEVYLSQEALRNNPNAVRATTHSRLHAGNPAPPGR